MRFHFSRRGLRGREAWLQRAGELLPGAASWTLLVGMVAVSCWRPVAAAMLVIAFALYWLLRLFYMTFFLVISHRTPVWKMSMSPKEISG